MLLQSGGGTWGTALYTVRDVGSGSRDVDAWRANGSVLRGWGAPSNDGPGAWQHCGYSMLRHIVLRLIVPDFPSIETRQLGRRFQIGMFQPIRVDHTNCLHMAIKSHSFTTSGNPRCSSWMPHRHGRSSLTLGVPLVIHNTDDWRVKRVQQLQFLAYFGQFHSPLSLYPMAFFM